MKAADRKRFAAEAAAALATALIGWFKIGDPDFFWHLKIGQLILERGRLVETNTLSALFAERPQLLSYLFFALTIFLAERYRRGGRASSVWALAAWPTSTRWRSGICCWGDGGEAARRAGAGGFFSSPSRRPGRRSSTPRATGS